MKKIILFACIAAFIGVSCKKDSTETTPNTICTTAMVHYGGDPAADGSGWVLVTDTTTGKFEKPDNLDAIFKTEGILVDICYVVTDVDFVCFCSPPLRKQIHLTAIKLH
jgi:hypothetical protein